MMTARRVRCQAVALTLPCWCVQLLLVLQAATNPASAWLSGSTSPYRIATAPPSAIQHQYPKITSVTQSSPTTTTSLFMATSSANKLWDRLSIEEDDEPMWYLLNCVATTELDLLRQCRMICEEMTEDVVKFVVPLEQKTRSHGANKMVTETKVKYPGYVFAKLRLCPHVYAAVQELDLCRSWMGTVNQKGHKKLPPVPVALNEVEVENFGLEDVDEDVDGGSNADGTEVDAQGIIVDSDKDDDEEYYSYEDPMYKNIDKKALKQFKGLKVADMVKVTGPGKFFNEDGIVRRLKEGRIFVRFYTYGTMFEEWMNPSDLRKLSDAEVIKGLSGPSQPITQRDFDGPEEEDNRGGYGGSGGRPADVRSVLTGGAGEQRNRRQDRVADRYKSGVGVEDQRRDADKNWNWYKEQQEQQQQSKPGGRPIMADNEWRMRAGSSQESVDGGSGKWAEGDADSQWGRSKPERQVRREVRKTTNQLANRQTKAAIEGSDDWSAFVSPSSGVAKTTGGSDDSRAADDFFASLMTDLNRDLDSTSSRDGGRSQRQQQPRAAPSATDTSSEDDFFASLMSELSNEAPMDRENSSVTPPKQLRRPPAVQSNDATDLGQDDDFFATLEAELGTALGETAGGGSSGNDGDDFFAQLEAELAPAFSTSKQQKASGSGSASSAGPSQQLRRPPAIRNNDATDLGQDDDFFANLEAELGSALGENAGDDAGGFFAQLEAELPPLREETSLSSAPSGQRKASGPVTAASSSINAGELTKKTVPVLKEMLRERGLKVGGNKAELVNRLLES